MAIQGYLIVKLNGQEVKRMEIPESGLVIGREPGTDLQLSDAQVSKRHARVQAEAEAVTLTDLKSSNGTLLDGVQLLPHQPRPLSNGATIQIGVFTLTFYEANVDLPSLSAESGKRMQDAQAAGLVPAVTRMWRFEKTPRAISTVETPCEVEPSQYLKYLPSIFHEERLPDNSSDQRSNFLNRFLKIFETIWEPLEQRQDHISMYFDPYTCPASFLPWLASWFDLPVDARLPESRLRLLVAEAVELQAWRGTHYGLTRLIEIYTGISPEISSSTTQPFVFQVSLPLGVDDEVAVEVFGGREELIGFVKDLIRTYKPAYAGYTLEVKK